MPAKKGSIPWNKGLTGLTSPLKGKKTGRAPWNKDTKGVCVAWNKGLKGIPSPKKGKTYGSHKKKRRKGIEPWNKGMKMDLSWSAWSRRERIEKICPRCETLFSVIPSEVHVVCCSVSCGQQGRKRADWEKKKISEGQRGEKNWRWKGGSKTDRNERHMAMGRMEYKDWRTAVFQRDGYACRECGDKQYVEAHHIFKWKDYPEVRYDVRNGYTFCQPCHKKADRGDIVIVPAIVPGRYYESRVEQVA